MPIWFTITDDRPPDVTIRAFRNMRRAANLAVGLQWDREFKPRHFDSDAATRYRYAERSANYLARIRRMLTSAIPKISRAAERPLIYSGLTRRQVLLRQIPRAFPTRVVVNLATPAYVRIRPRAGLPPLADEITRVNADERRELAATMHRTFETELAAFRATRTKTFGG